MARWDQIERIRDRVVANAGFAAGQRVLDIGAGDGLLVARSVFIYLEDRAAVARECYRLLRPGGRAVIFEPINRYGAVHRWCDSFAAPAFRRHRLAAFLAGSPSTFRACAHLTAARNYQTNGYLGPCSGVATLESMADGSVALRFARAPSIFQPGAATARKATMQVRIHHVQVAIPPNGEARARAFYGVLLGLAEVAKPEHLQGRGGVWFQTGNLQVHLGVDRAFRPAEKAHVAFQVADLVRLRRDLDAAGYATTEDEPLPGYARCYVNDPFGNRTELVEPR